MVDFSDILECSGILDIILSFTISQFVDLFKYGTINHSFQLLLHGNFGFTFFNNQTLLSMKYLITYTFMLDAEEFLFILAQTESSICGSGSDLLGLSIQGEIVQETFDLDILVRCSPNEDTLDDDYVSAADQLGNFLTYHNYSLQKSFQPHSCFTDFNEVLQESVVCAAYVYEVFTYICFDGNNDNNKKCVQVIVLMDTKRSFKFSIPEPISYSETKELISSSAYFVFVRSPNLLYRLSVSNDSLTIRTTLSSIKNHIEYSLICLRFRLFCRIEKYLNKNFKFESNDNHQIMIIDDLYNFPIYF